MSNTLHIVKAQNTNNTTCYKTNYILEISIKAYIYSKSFLALDYRLLQLFFFFFESHVPLSSILHRLEQGQKFF